jgi:hypothetical protein
MTKNKLRCFKIFLKMGIIKLGINKGKGEAQIVIDAVLQKDFKMGQIIN